MRESTRSTLLQYLPAIFHGEPDADKPDEIGLGQYLVPFEEVFDEFRALLSRLDAYVAPELTPSGDFLAWLAAWVALPPDEHWTEDQRRRLIREAVELYRWRGTVHGLKRYVELYTNIQREHVVIEEAQWPGGMQIGVASRIGQRQSTAGAVTDGTPGLAVVKQDYYVVSTQAPTNYPAGTIPELPDGSPVRLFYPADCVTRIDIEENGVRMFYRPPDGSSTNVFFHLRPIDQFDHPNIKQQSELIDYFYQRTDVHETGIVRYRGSTFLIPHLPSPYRFIVRVTVPEQRGGESPEDNAYLSRLRSVLEIEKPAHTDYYLKITPAQTTAPMDWMQIEVHSSVGLDTTIGRPA